MIGDTLYGFSLALSIANLVFLFLMIVFGPLPYMQWTWWTAGRFGKGVSVTTVSHTRVTRHHQHYANVNGHNSSSDSSSDGEYDA